MPHPAVYVAAAAVIGIAVFVAIFAANSEKPQPMSYGRGGSGSYSRHRPPSPPPSPVFKPSQPRKRRQKRSNSPERAATAETSQTCRNCNESFRITVKPCCHASLCRGCFKDRLENNPTCPDCSGRIDSLSPSIPPYGKCTSCRRYTKIFKFLECNHSLSLCIKCYEEQGLNYKNCPECHEKIKGSEPRYSTSGTCRVCDEFKRLAKFQPCGHSSCCRRCASLCLESGNNECIDCGRRVTKIA